MIRTEGLTKRYDSRVAVENLNLHVREGEIYGFLGPNGAGKTTTIYLLLGLLEPTDGRVFLFGQPLAEGGILLKRRVGVVAEEPPSTSKMTGWELVHFFADLHGVVRPEGRMEVLFRALDLWDARHVLAHAYSRGMRQKLSLIRAMVHEPELLILDEPVSGLDPSGILQVREVVEAHRREGGSVLISSHILSEVERSADRIGILHRGRLLIEDTVEGIRCHLSHVTVVRLELVEVLPSLSDALAVIPNVERVDVEGRQVEVHVTGRHDVRPEIFRTVVEEGGVLLEMGTEQMSLEEAFVTITNQNVELLVGAP
ncbi:MAG: ABC transporter ATP-binding protein [Chloroflexota bacterium]|nr:ABC transporter ATP-binding protein [Chloroflexota bacterium]